MKRILRNHTEAWLDAIAMGLVAMGYEERTSSERYGPGVRYFHYSGSSVAHVWLSRGGSVRWFSLKRRASSLALSSKGLQAILNRASGYSTGPIGAPRPAAREKVTQ